MFQSIVANQSVDELGRRVLALFDKLAGEVDRGDDLVAEQRGMIAQLAHDVDRGDALVGELRGVIADLRQDRDHWREQAQRLALLAPKPVERPPATPLPAPKLVEHLQATSVDPSGNSFVRAWRWMRHPSQATPVDPSGNGFVRAWRWMRHPPSAPVEPSGNGFIRAWRWMRSTG